MEYLNVSEGNINISATNLSDVEKLIEEKVESQRDEDGEFINTYQSVIFKQIALVIEHFDYLKKESRNKTNHISHLMGYHHNVSD